MFTSRCFAIYTEPACLNILDAVFCTVLSTPLRAQQQNWTVRGKKKLEQWGMNNEEWLPSAHSAFIEREELWCAQRYGNAPAPLPGRLTRMLWCSLGANPMYALWNVRLTEESVLPANASEKRRPEKAGVIKSINGGYGDVFILLSLLFLSLTYIALTVSRPDGRHVTINVLTPWASLSVHPLWWRVLRQQTFFFSTSPVSVRLL